MEAKSGLMRRVERLEQQAPSEPCRTCAARPVFTIGGDAVPCAECGSVPFTFTIDVDRAGGREGDAA